MGITNFLEGDLFSWYLAVWSDPIEKMVRRIVTKLDAYNPGTFSEDPAQSRDLLKKLYQQLFPKSVRHDLGEYYTPDWLAEHVLNELGYAGDPDRRLLDPACGSGTFLVMTINRIRRWYDQNREKCAYDEGELLKKILANVVGFDLNPLAVMAARTNYLVAIKDLIRHVDGVEIPVYLCDSIMTPAEYGDLFTGGAGNVAKVPCSAMKPPHLLVPKEIARSPKEVAKYADILETCVKNGYASEEFLSRCRDEGLNITATEAHGDLYIELVKLDKANKNGVWARIIKNNFAPLFQEPFDHVAGNPPWVRWNYLPGEYRAEISPLWQRYGLFAKKGFMARLATAELDFSMLYLYACLDAFVQPKGSLGFVITLEVVKSKGAGEGFRRFRLGVEGSAFRVTRVDDMVALKPFHASNKTAVIFCRKGEETEYPVPYFRWRRLSASPDLAEKSDLDFVRSMTGREGMIARPVNEPTSPWQTLLTSQATAMEKVKGVCSYVGHSGIAVDPYGVYLLRLQGTELGSRYTTVSNATDLGDIKVQPQTSSVESSLLFPAVRGKDIRPWHAAVSLWVLVTNRSPRKEDQIPEATMRRDFPRAFSNLNL